MSKTGIFGGTFNPVHKGHEKIALEFYDKFKLDKLIIIPANIPPHKQIGGKITAGQRFEMCGICFNKYKDYNICVSDCEIKNDNISYSYNTLTEIKNNDRDAKLYFLVGSDMFLYLENWYKYRDLFELCAFVVAFRDNRGRREVLELREKFIRSGAVIEMLENEAFEISSSEIRNNIKNNNLINLEKYMSAEVLDYIKENNIYAE